MTCEACRTIPPVISEGYTPKGTSYAIGELGFDTCNSYPLIWKADRVVC